MEINDKVSLKLREEEAEFNKEVLDDLKKEKVLLEEDIVEKKNMIAEKEEALLKVVRGHYEENLGQFKVTKAEPPLYYSILS